MARHFSLSTSDNPCAECPIRHRAVCSHCEPDELKKLEEIKYYRSFEAGQPIVWAGDKMEFVGSVVKGICTLSQTMEDGRTQITGLLMASDFLGRPGRETIRFDVTAITDVTLCCFRKKPFEHLMDITPHIGSRLLDMSLDELDAAREWMLLLGRKTARERIASLLVMIVNRQALDPDADGNEIGLPMSRESIADFLGMTLETVSRQLNALNRDKTISLIGRREVRVPDLALLKEAAGID
jgi:CRP/FNR family transcriptional regulator